ncbi:hypothetical protein MMYC01_206005 [Madurella mycetomatis]|uniref:Cell surface protein n=1 Tax=Madurella mycetomatis TaxID=100816 RepID=A0A175W498_9PEZI|nr:hypothetical protein MMYC01_206005 [Madurella mycetomatis]
MHATNVVPFVAILIAQTSAHGVVTMVRGANGVDMPGLRRRHPRDCSTNRCGSQADTAIIRDREIRRGEVGPLGRTQGNGPIDPATMITNFMGGASAPRNNGANSSVGVEDNIAGQLNKRSPGQREGRGVAKIARQLFGGLFGGSRGGGNRGTESPAATEAMVAATAGMGATAGMPTCGDDGSIEMVFHQVNQDGAGPIEAAVDGTSGGTDPDAFQQAEVTQDVPGFGFQGLSLATSRDFPLTVQMPAGMTCDATVAGVENVCIVRVRNGAAAGPFGGSAAFTQSAAARKRAIEYRRRKRAEVFRA